MKSSLFWFRIFCGVSVCITWVLIPYGALVRLNGAGLACPDWPLCYGKLIPPPGLEIFMEVSHRFIATLLGILIIGMFVLSFQGSFPKRLKYYSLFALVWVCVQGIFGALTVTMALLPSIVTAHLIGGIGLFWILIFLWAYSQKLENPGFGAGASRCFSTFGLWAMNLTLLIILISGGLNSSRYAGYVCDAFPLCQSSDPFTFSWNSEEGFTTRVHSESVEIEGEVIPVNILEWTHMAHRALAIFGGGFLIFLAFFSIRIRENSHGIWIRWFLVIGILAEIGIGILNAVWRIPLPVSAFHTFLAGSLAGVIAYASALKLVEGKKR